MIYGALVALLLISRKIIIDNQRIDHGDSDINIARGQVRVLGYICGYTAAGALIGVAISELIKLV